MVNFDFSPQNLARILREAGFAEAVFRDFQCVSPGFWARREGTHGVSLVTYCAPDDEDGANVEDPEVMCRRYAQALRAAIEPQPLPNARPWLRNMGGDELIVGHYTPGGRR